MGIAKTIRLAGHGDLFPYKQFQKSSASANSAAPRLPPSEANSLSSIQTFQGNLLFPTRSIKDKTTFALIFLRSEEEYLELQ